MQLTRSRKTISGLALAGALVLAGLVGFAQQQETQEKSGKQRTEGHWGQRGDKGRGGRGGFGGRFFEKLNLTDAQREQMKQIATRYHEGSKAKRQQKTDRGGGQFDLLSGGTFNEAAVRAAAQARANERVEMEVARAHMMFEMFNVLTPEQKAQLAAERQEREQKRQQFRSRRGANTGQAQ